jgi:hypothetical protein
MDPFPSSGEGRKTPTLLGLSERANRNLLTPSSEPFKFYQKHCIPLLDIIRSNNTFLRRLHEITARSYIS